MRKLIFTLFIIFSSLTYSQTSYYLEGKINKSILYINITDYSSLKDNSVGATYFYKNSLKDIVLDGTKKKTTFDLVFLDTNHNDKILEKFELTKQSNGTFNGFWTNKLGKKFPITLKPINFAKYGTPKTKDSDTKLDVIKQSLLVFKQDSISKYKGKEFIWYSEKHCISPFFRLGNTFTEKCISIINPILTQIHTENTLAQLDCSSSFAYSKGEGIEYTVSVNFLDPNLLSFQVFSSWDCGGAHPDFGGTGYLVDLNTGKNYELDEIIAFDKSVTTEAEGGFDNFSKYRSSFFAPKLLALIDESEHFKKPTENDEEEECDYTNLNSWNFISWNFTEKGIEFTPYFYRAARNCDNPFLLPFEKLIPYKNKTFPYSFPK